MKKFIAMLACLTMVLTMFAGLTVSAADYGTPTVTLTYTGDNSKGYAQISVKYSGFENFVAFDQDYYDSEGYSIVTGIAAMSANFTADNGAKYQGGAKKLCTVSTAASGVQSCNTFAQGFDSYITESTGEMAVIRYEITDKTKDTTITLTDAEFTVTAIVDDEIVDSKTYKFADVTVVPCVIPGETPATESAYNVTYAGDKVVWGDKPATTVSSTDASKTVTFTVKPAFGYVITAVTGVATAIPEGGEMTATIDADNTEIVVTVAEKTDAAITYEYVTYDENYGWIAFGKVPAGTATYGIDLDGTKYEGANAADGAFGVGFKGLAAGSYTAKAYAGETLAATSATIVVE